MKKIEEDKIWVTITRNVQLESYENYKLEAGLSQTIKDKEDPMQLLDEAELKLSEFVIEKTEEIREEYEKQNNKRRRKR